MSIVVVIKELVQQLEHSMNSKVKLSVALPLSLLCHSNDVVTLTIID